MPDPREPRAIIEEAEQAAAAGNYASAETLLREAALMQEVRLGPLHPDLANTLNNLGVVCEITGKPADAEQSFRRALNIATTVLHPDHPFVVTSRKNLSDFCEARGKPVQQSSAETEDPELVSRKLFTRFALGALGPIAMLMVILAAGLPRLNSSGRPPSPSPMAMDSSQNIPAPAPVSVEPIPSAADATKGTEDEEGPDEVSVSHITAAAPATPKVVRARLCADLDEWRCDPPDDPVPAGELFFYTQLKSTSATKVQHRWYRDDRLNQSVELRVEANRSGYRTYSRSTMSRDSAGDWRVELRTEDGVLLHEERFSVR